MELNKLTRLSVNLGATLADRKKTVAQIKHAMTLAIMMQVENNSIDRDNPDFAIFQTIYLEANYLEDQLNKI